MKRTTRLLGATLLAAVATLALAVPAGAAPKKNDPPAVGSGGTIALNNDRAGTENDCPADGLAYWHFVLAPNNGQFAFTSITLNLGGTPITFTGGQIVQNGTQTDNVFVAVPLGYTLESLIATGSSAVYTGPVGRTPNRFNLSHVCPAYTGGGPGVLGETAGPAATDTGAGQAVVASATAVRPSTGALPYTGDDTTVPFAQFGVALVAAGALTVFAVRRRNAGQGV